MAKKPSLKNLSKVSPKTFKGIVFRNVSQGYNPLNDIGSFNKGGRWNRVKVYGAIYSTLARETCIGELKREAKRRNLDVEDLLPRDIVSLKVRLKKVLDLTDPDILSLLEISQENLILDEDHSLPQKIAHAARKLGYEAILSPSATRKGKNLNIYLDMIHEDSVVEVVKKGLLEL